MITITFPDKSVKQFEDGVTPLQIAQSLSSQLARDVLAASVNEEALEMAKLAKSQGIEVDVIGVGSLKGAPIPIDSRRGEYLKDNAGNPVTTYLNENMAKEIASAGGGIYINGSGSKAVDQLVESLDQIKKSDLQHVSYKASAEQFPVFVWIAVILLVIDACVLPRKIGWLKKFTFFSRTEK